MDLKPQSLVGVGIPEMVQLPAESGHLEEIGADSRMGGHAGIASSWGEAPHGKLTDIFGIAPPIPNRSVVLIA